MDTDNASDYRPENPLRTYLAETTSPTQQQQQRYQVNHGVLGASLPVDDIIRHETFDSREEMINRLRELGVPPEGHGIYNTADEYGSYSTDASFAGWGPVETPERQGQPDTTSPTSGTNPIIKTGDQEHDHAMCQDVTAD